MCSEGLTSGANTSYAMRVLLYFLMVAFTERHLKPHDHIAGYHWVNKRQAWISAILLGSPAISHHKRGKF
jgi:hypothetical protein